jgi:hypothetical protein
MVNSPTPSEYLYPRVVRAGGAGVIPMDTTESSSSSSSSSSSDDDDDPNSESNRLPGLIDERRHVRLPDGDVHIVTDDEGEIIKR